MTRRDHALQLLSRAGESDRRWILQRLSSAARARLSSADAPAASAKHPTGVAAEIIAKLETAEAAHMFELLRAEPGWLVSALLHAHPWPWAKKVLERLPSHMRAQITRLKYARLSLPPAALEFLMRDLSRRVRTGMRTSTARSPFESLLVRLGKRQPR